MRFAIDTAAELLLSYSVFFDYEIHILIPSAREIDKNRSALHILRKLAGVSNRVRALDSGNYTLKS